MRLVQNSGKKNPHKTNGLIFATTFYQIKKQKKGCYKSLSCEMKMLHAESSHQENMFPEEMHVMKPESSSSCAVYEKECRLTVKHTFTSASLLDLEVATWY